METCAQCGLKRPRGASTCPRCGFSFAGAGPVNLVLKAVGGEVPAQQWLLSAEENVIGRGHSAAVALAHDSVSRHHARVSRGRQGFEIEDLGSTNGTFVNDRRISTATPIAGGDRVTIGHVHLVAELQQAVALQAATAAAASNPGTAILDLDDAMAAALAMPEPPLNPPAAVEDEGPTNKYQTQPLPAPDAVARARQEPAPAVAGQSSPAALDLPAAVEEAAKRLRTLDSVLQSALSQIDQVGGRAALATAIEQATKTAASPQDIREVMALTQLAGQIQTLLAATQALLETLAPASASEEPQTD